MTIIPLGYKVKDFIVYLQNAISSLRRSQLSKADILTRSIRNHTNYVYAPNITMEERVKITKDKKIERSELKLQRNAILNSSNRLNILLTRLNHLYNLNKYPDDIEHTLKGIGESFDVEKLIWFT